MDWGQEEKGMTEDEMAGWHHRLDGHESECVKFPQELQEVSGKVLVCSGTSGLTGSTLLLPATSLLSSLTRAHSPAYGSTATFSKAVTSP